MLCSLSSLLLLLLLLLMLMLPLCALRVLAHADGAPWVWA
jgi:hypothetical protein